MSLKKQAADVFRPGEITGRRVVLRETAEAQDTALARSLGASNDDIYLEVTGDSYEQPHEEGKPRVLTVKKENGEEAIIGAH